MYLRVEPSVGEETEASADGFVFVDDTFGGSVPKQFMPAIEKGVKSVMSDGAIAGYPMYNIKVTVYDGKHHAVDSKEIAFMTTGKKAFIEAVKKKVEHFYGTTEQDRCATGDFARIVNARHHQRIGGLIHDAVERGAKVELGGNLEAGENFIAPTVLTNVPEDAKIMQEEIFGPVMPVFSFKTMEEVVQKINSKEKPLALYIFSKKKRTREYLLQNTSTGGVAINDTILHHSQPNLPFGGVNNSGIGAGHGEWGFKAFSHERAVLKQYMKKGAPQWMYPPYNNFARKMIDFTLKYF